MYINVYKKYKKKSKSGYCNELWFYLFSFLSKHYICVYDDYFNKYQLHILIYINYIKI